MSTYLAIKTIGASVKQTGRWISKGKKTIQWKVIRKIKRAAQNYCPEPPLKRGYKTSKCSLPSVLYSTTYSKHCRLEAQAKKLQFK